MEILTLKESLTKIMQRPPSKEEALAGAMAQIERMKAQNGTWHWVDGKCVKR